MSNEFKEMKETGYTEIAVDGKDNLLKNDTINMTDIKETGYMSHKLLDTCHLLRKLFDTCNDAEPHPDVLVQRSSFIKKHADIAMDFITPPNRPIVEVSFKTNKKDGKPIKIFVDKIPKSCGECIFFGGKIKCVDMGTDTYRCPLEVEMSSKIDKENNND